jgi:hypothetical protein
MPLRAALGRCAVLSLLGTFFILSACVGSRPAGPDRVLTDVRGEVTDSVTESPVDSFRVYSKQGDSTLQATDGSFAINDLSPGLYLFRVDAYGYHEREHVAVLARPGDSLKQTEVGLLRQTLDLACQGFRQQHHDDIQARLDRDSTAVQLRLTGIYADDDSVRLQPVLVNDMSLGIYVPRNLGPLDHYEITLLDGDGTPIGFRHAGRQSAPDSLHRIYKERDLTGVNLGSTEQLAPTTLVLEDSLPPGSAVYARMRYRFPTEQTLRPTQVAGFSTLNLDSLQTPVYDTLRVPAAVTTPDSLVVRRDTTVLRVVGRDTTVSRNDYLLYSTRRDSNATPSAEDAVSLLYVPDSVKARARRDSLIAQGVDSVLAERNELPEVPARSFRLVTRSDSAAVDRYIRDPFVARAMRFGLPRSLDQLLALRGASDDSLRQVLRSPEITYRPIRRAEIVDSVQIPYPSAQTMRRVRPDSTLPPSVVPADSLQSDSLQSDSLQSDSLQSDSLQSDSLQGDPLTADSLRRDSVSLGAEAPDSTAADSVRPPPRDSVAGPALARSDSLAADSLAADSLAADSLAADSLRSDSTQADSLRRAQRRASRLQRRAARRATRPDSALAETVLADTLMAGSARVDSLRRVADSLRARPDSLQDSTQTAYVAIMDSVVVDSVAEQNLTERPSPAYLYVPPALTVDSRGVLLVNPIVNRLQARTALDTVGVSDLAKLTPTRLGEPPRTVVRDVIQQIITVPRGGYREKYLATWKDLQRRTLRARYCNLFRPVLTTPWRSTVVR